MRWVSAFGRFWYAFIVGDSVTLAIGAPAALVVGFLLVRGGQTPAAELLLPLVVLATLVVSLRR